jgi:hypothetical protein
MSKKSSSRPAASFDATYSVYENSKQRPLPKHLVDLIIENFIMVEVGGWGTNIKIHVKKGAKVSTKTTENGTTIYCEPPKNVKTSVMSQKQLTAVVGAVIKTADGKPS